MSERSHKRSYANVILIALIMLSYGLFLSGVTLLVGTTIFENNPLLIALLLVFLALAFNPIREWLLNTVIKKSRHIQPIQKQTFEEYTFDLTSAKTPFEITEVMRGYIIEKVNPYQLHIFLFDPISNTYHTFTNGDSGDKRTSSEIGFSVESSLVKTLSQTNTPIIINNPGDFPESIKPEISKIALLNTSIFIPLQGRSQLMGWIAIGNPTEGIPYNRKDVDFLQELGDHAALLVERVQISLDLERRIKEMNVLTRVSQGVNITLAFDDMLELIYSQINQIMQLNVFHVILRSPENNSLNYVFYIDEDERFNERENVTIPDGYGLDEEVITGQRPLVTDDYEKECRRRGCIPNLANLYAWAGIPLNTGAETIGLISLGSRKPNVYFSTEQINLLQSIADQTAGAMIKVRLLQEAERRTNQLRYLNEITRDLSETLEPQLLLSQVLESAIELLNCKSGRIYLLDKHSNKLVLKEEQSGDFYNNLNDDLDKDIDEYRMRSVTQGKVVNLNDEIIHLKTVDNQTDEFSSSIINGLIVPMQLKDENIGLLEVFNRNDDLTFTNDDQELLSAFAGQSAIAYENALKYTLTDRSLAARVEELSVMQRIDRELNANLDVALAMNITMEWAIRQSQAESGYVGIVEDGTIRVMSSHGYDEANLPGEITVNENTPLLKNVLDNGQPQNILLTDLDKIALQANIMEGAQAQYIVPIKRENEVIGIIFLESRHLAILPEDTMGFLVRLSDHAAIAIANAQLYLEVQAANLAKSEFVSFVSHELKTPMTSIKGFADLLAAGAVGPISDAQNNFLTTIRSNVDRMATLVSDLTDVSRIEAGRMRLEYEAVPVKDVIDEVVRSSNNQIDSKEQTLDVEIVKNLSALWGDRTRLIQILTNLVSNANKYSPPGSQIIIKAEQSKNVWDPSGSSQVIQISVKDNGYGIDPQDQGKIFEKFFRADDPNIREVSGTGLGLNITKTLIEMQGGKIWFESILNQGTTFHFTIPIAENS